MSEGLDRCINCQLRGDIKTCESVECNIHVSWYAKTLKQEIIKTKEELEKFKTALNNVKPFISEDHKKILNDIDDLLNNER